MNDQNDTETTRGAAVASSRLFGLPSFYGGRVFRSRLEARWAVYFNLIGFPTVGYESEGFALDAGNYLPDFHDSRTYPYGHESQKGGTFVEVKPTMDGFLDCLPKLQELSLKAKAAVVCVIGYPSPKPFPAFIEGQEVCNAAFTWYGYTRKGWLEPYWTEDYPSCEKSENAARIAARVKFNNGRLCVPNVRSEAPSK